MQIIPVLDLYQGVVVHARMGQRDRYRPLNSGLCPGHEPRDLCRALLRLGPFSHLYIADLDAIGGHGDNLDLIREIHQACPGIQIWLDAGRASARLAAPGLIPVIGSESLHHGEELQSVLTRLGGEGCILSLDFRHGCLLGPPALLRLRAYWPRRIIVMSLDRVGAGQGPDLERLAEYAAGAPGYGLYAAGGVRGRRDLQELSRIGVAGVLVASALHDGRLDRQTIIAEMTHQDTGAPRSAQGPA